MGMRRNWILSTLYSIYSAHHGQLRVVKTKKATLIGRGQVSGMEKRTSAQMYFLLGRCG